MSADIPIRDIRFVPATQRSRDIEVDDDVRRKPELIGYASLVSGPFLLDGFGVHAHSDGRFSISFPTRKSPSGKVHRIVRARSQRARYEIERQILLALDRQGCLR